MQHVLTSKAGANRSARKHFFLHSLFSMQPSRQPLAQLARSNRPLRCNRPTTQRFEASGRPRQDAAHLIGLSADSLISCGSASSQPARKTPGGFAVASTPLVRCLRSAWTAAAAAGQCFSALPAAAGGSSVYAKPVHAVRSTVHGRTSRRAET